MNSPRTTRAVILIVAVFLGGCAVGAFAFKSLSHPPGGRFGQGAWGRPQQQDWVQAFKLDSIQADSVYTMRRRAMRNIDSITKARIGVQIDSIENSINPALDSLYGTIRADIDSIRAQSRAATRMALPESLRVRYDSVIAAADSSRRRALEQRRNGARGGGTNRDGRDGPGGRGPGRGGGGPPGSGNGSK